MPRPATGGTSKSAVASREGGRGGHASFDRVFGLEATAASGASPAEDPDGRPPLKHHYLLDPPASPANVTAIPRTIHKVYFQKRGGFPDPSSFSDELAAAHRSWRDLNPRHELRYWDLKSAREYLIEHFHPVFLRAFDCLQPFASKSDLFRMALLYREGGWYSDWKEVCLKENLLDDIARATNFFAVWDKLATWDRFKHRCIQNGFVGATPRHPIARKMLALTLIQTQKVHYGTFAFDAAGSVCLFGRAVIESEKEEGSANFVEHAAEPGEGEREGTVVWRGESVVRHKCAGCGGTQDWGKTGNNYLQMWIDRKFYCEDAASLFRTSCAGCGASDPG
ncbi:hypothetical protein ACHAWF_006446 [Thalassiosira exigua]